MLFLDA
jgi:hypothetical protein